MIAFPSSFSRDWKLQPLSGQERFRGEADYGLIAAAPVQSIVRLVVPCCFMCCICDALFSVEPVSPQRGGVIFTRARMT